MAPMSTRIAFLHLASGAYDRPAIMARAWAYARNQRTRMLGLGDTISFGEALCYGLTKAWDDARGARAIAVFHDEQDAAFAAAQVSARSAAIFDLEAARAAADGIDNTARFLAERGAIEARLGELRAAA